MYQEAALALALAARQPTEWFSGPAGGERLRELAIAATCFAARSAHRNGALDDYYPCEQAVGATAFALRAAVETARLFGLREPRLLDWFRRAACWLAEFDESGRLANHHALVALTLFRVGQWLGEETFISQARDRLQRLLSWQSDEGWFPEYDGCDPGYHTVCTAFLAQLWHDSGWPELEQPLHRAAQFAAAVQHPDGTIGGEYGSRNTFHCYVHGFELLAEQSAAARNVLARLCDALASGRQQPLDDDRMVAHYAVDLLLAERDLKPVSPRSDPRPAGGWYPDAGFAIRHSDPWWWIVGTRKGGSFRLYKESTLLAADTGLVARLADGRVAASAVLAPDQVSVGEHELELRGQFGLVDHPLLSPVKQTVFRAVTLSIGRWWPNLIRRILQRRAITGAQAAPLRYVRRIRWFPHPAVEDEVWVERGATLAELWLTTDATFRYVAASNSFQPGAALRWQRIEDVDRQIATRGCVSIVRHWP